jgi:hypothetical protein
MIIYTHGKGMESINPRARGRETCKEAEVPEEPEMLGYCRLLRYKHMGEGERLRSTKFPPSK